MTNPLVLSVLDQSPISEGSTGADALRNTLDLARLADDARLPPLLAGRAPRRHRCSPGPSPEVLIGPVAMATTRIRVGSGGVMLPHYSPLKVAESFSILAGLFPGRIDLAIGRAPGTDPMTTFALQRDRRQAAPDDFPTQLAELLGLLEDRLPARPPVRAPRRPSRPPPRARAVAAGLLAAERHLGRRAGPALRLRRLHQPHRRADRGQLPHAVRRDRARPGPARRRRRVGHLRRHRRGGAAARRQRAHGDDDAAPRAPDPHPAGRQGACASWSPRAGARRDAARAPHRAWARRRPSPPACARWPTSTPPTRSIVVSITHDHEARRRSYELIAEAFDLAARRGRGAASPPSGYLQGVADAPAPAPGVRTRPARFVPRLHWELLVCGVAGHELIGLDAAPGARGGRAGHARDRRRALAPLPALRQLADPPAARRSRARAPARPRRDRAAAARTPAARQDRPAPHRHQPRRALLRPRAARRRDPALRLAPRRISATASTASSPTCRAAPSPAAGTASTGCSARSTSSSRCSPRGFTSSPP